MKIQNQDTNEFFQFEDTIIFLGLTEKYFLWFTKYFIADDVVIVEFDSIARKDRIKKRYVSRSRNL